MNKYITDFNERLKERNLTTLLDEKNENVIWFRAKLPHAESTPLFYVSFDEITGSFTLFITQLFKIKKPTIEIMSAINTFNSNPKCFACKMFLDHEGDITLNINAFLERKIALDLFDTYIDIAVAAIDSYYPLLEEMIQKGE